MQVEKVSRIDRFKQHKRMNRERRRRYFLSIQVPFDEILEDAMLNIPAPSCHICGEQICSHEIRNLPHDGYFTD